MSLLAPIGCPKLATAVHVGWWYLPFGPARLPLAPGLSAQQDCQPARCCCQETGQEVGSLTMAGLIHKV